MRITALFRYSAVGYKLFASILLFCLRGAGAEDRIWTTQMGFRNNRGTGDAIFFLQDA